MPANQTSTQADPEEILRQKEIFNFALFQHNPTPTVIVDREGCVVKSNLARRRSKQGLPPLGTPLFRGDAGPEEAELHVALQQSIRSGEVRRLAEYAIGGRYYSITLAPFPQGAIVSTTDITEHKQAMEQLIHADKMVALGTLVSGVAHEISNPNNVLLLNASALGKLAQNLSSFLGEQIETRGDFDLGATTCGEARNDLRELVDGITRAGERIRDAVNELKDFARKDTAALVQRVDVGKVVESARRLLQPVIEKATGSFELKLAADLPRVAANAQRIEQVVVNLIANACQALTDPKQAVRVCTRHLPERNAVAIDVRDEGRGIAPGDLKRVTDPFFTTRQDRGGTGLGLSISRKIVEAYGGILRFDSRPGTGTTASVVLPAAPKDKE